jgi:hypothetical protein
MNDTPSNELEPVGQKSPLLDFIEKNPVSAVLQALAVGFAVGMLIRLLDRRDEEKVVDVKHKPSMDEAKYHIGSLLLPFLWPAWLKAREGYGKSSDAVKDTISKAKSGKLTKEGKDRLREVEKWVEQEAETLADLGKKGAKGLEDWAERQGEQLTDLAKKVKDLEQWVEGEVLPVAETGWKKVRKFFR